MKNSIKTFLKFAAKDTVARSANPAIVRASTIYFKTMQEMRKHQKIIAKGKAVKHWDYGRQGSQTTIQLQNILKELEEAHEVFLTQTGFGPKMHFGAQKQFLSKTPTLWGPTAPGGGIG